MKFLVYLCLILSINTFANVDEILGGMDGVSNPNRFNPNYTRTFSKLPLTGSARKEGYGWSGYYWPTNKGGVAHRWQVFEENPLKREYPSKRQIMSYSTERISRLSPAEKYDLYMGRYNFPISKRRITRRFLRAPIHNGICNGWTISTMNHLEPDAKTVKNSDGIIIPFGASDVKAIMAYHYAKYSRVADGKIFVGQRCMGRVISGGCKGLNPGSFHVILGNRIGLEGKAFAADVSKGKEVWNHPFMEYKSTVLESYTKDDITVKIIETIATHSDGLKEPSWFKALGTDKQIDTAVTYKYSLYLNYRGEIIGGKWLSYYRPDFVWYLKGIKKFSGEFEGLNRLL